MKYLMSSKRVIAVDFDDVVVETGVHILDHFEEVYGLRVHPRHLYATSVEVWGIDLKEFEQRVTYFHSNEQVQNLRVVEEAARVLPLLSQFAELHIVTGRPPSLTDVTQGIIDMHFPGIFSSVNFTNVFSAHPISKAEVCRRLGADLLIDDHIGHVNDVASQGIEVLLFGNHPWNQTTQLPDRVRRVSGWSEVLELLKPVEK